VTPVIRPAFHSLLLAAAEPYRSAGRFAYHFARGKLGTDPAYRAVLEFGLLQGRERIRDLGCGQGLLSAWIHAAQSRYDGGQWPPGWPPAPRPTSTRGIELMLKDVQRARRALGETSEILQGDIRSADYGAVDAVVIFDVLHYMERAAQVQVLRRVRAALPAQGLLLLRIGDASAGLRFHYTNWCDKVIMLMRGHSLVTTHCRGIAEWRALLKECDFECEARPMSRGTPFANVLLIARAC
jgi:cyclopropane fatty-acyl-phospholipid synthase-like methyltransferase